MNGRHKLHTVTFPGELQLLIEDSQPVWVITGEEQSELVRKATADSSVQVGTRGERIFFCVDPNNLFSKLLGNFLRCSS